MFILVDSCTSISRHGTCESDQVCKRYKGRSGSGDSEPSSPLEGSSEQRIPYHVATGVFKQLVDVDLVSTFESVILLRFPEVEDCIISCVLSDDWALWLELSSLEFGCRDVQHLPACHGT